MRNCLKKQLSLLLSLCLLAGVMSPCTIYAADETLSVTLSKPYLVKSDQAQTVEMYVRLPAGSRCEIFRYDIVNSGPVKATAATKGDDDQISGDNPCIVDTVADEDRTADYVNLGTVTYTVPAGTEGTFQLGVSGVELHNGANFILRDGAQAVTLTVYSDASQLPSQGRTAVLSGRQWDSGGYPDLSGHRHRRQLCRGSDGADLRQYEAGTCDRQRTGGHRFREHADGR